MVTMHWNLPHRFFSEAEQSRLAAAIREAESQTSGEVRIHLIRSARGDLLEVGKRIFEKLGMTRTAERNGILFLLELKHHRLAILGDKGIHEKVPQDFWGNIRDIVLEEFHQERFAEGLTKGVLRCGEQLKIYFPSRAGDRNELSDQITSE